MNTFTANRYDGHTNNTQGFAHDVVIQPDGTPDGGTVQRYIRRIWLLHLGSLLRLATTGTGARPFPRKLWPYHPIIIRSQFLPADASRQFNSGAVFNGHRSATAQPVADGGLPGSANEPCKLGLASCNLDGFQKCVHKVNLITFVIIESTPT